LLGRRGGAAGSCLQRQRLRRSLSGTATHASRWSAPGLSASSPHWYWLAEVSAASECWIDCGSRQALLTQMLGAMSRDPTTSAWEVEGRPPWLQAVLWSVLTAGAKPSLVAEIGPQMVAHLQRP